MAEMNKNKKMEIEHLTGALSEISEKLSSFEAIFRPANLPKICRECIQIAENAIETQGKLGRFNPHCVMRLCPENEWMCIAGPNNFEPTVKSIQRNVYNHDFLPISDEDAELMLGGKESKDCFITYKLKSHTTKPENDHPSKEKIA